MVGAIAEYMAGFNEYNQVWQQLQNITARTSLQGVPAVQNDLALAQPLNNRAASIAGHTEYIAGWNQAATNIRPAQNTQAYLEGYQDYI